MLTGRITLAEMPDESNAGHGLTTAPPMHESKGQFRAGKSAGPTASTGLLERAMGIELYL